MEETISVRIPREDLIMIDNAMRYIKRKRSDVLRQAVELGIKQVMLEIALEKFQKNEATAAKAANIARIPLTSFLDILVGRKISFHYGKEEFRKDFEDLI